MPLVDAGEESTQRPTLTGAQKKERARKAKEAERAIAEATQKLKKRRGGWRPGSGRRPNYLKRSKLPLLQAHVILASVDLIKIWGRLLNSKDESIRLLALIYLKTGNRACPSFRARCTTSTNMSACMRGELDILTPSTGNVPYKALGYECESRFPRWPNDLMFFSDTIQVTGSSLSTQGIQALFGRDILSRCTLFYNGADGFFTLSY